MGNMKNQIQGDAVKVNQALKLSREDAQMINTIKKELTKV
jgi:hypothetical protein